jgi:DNA-binding CsgD family transcriptional regulator
VNDYINGFSPENLERIYLGEPALVDGNPIEDRLSPKKYEVAQLAANGLTYEEIAGELGRSISTVRDHIGGIYKDLGVYSRINLAGFFPIEPDHPILQGKKLSQQSTRNGVRQLQTLEGLSAGKQYKVIAGELSIRESTTRTHIHMALNIWPECQKAVSLVRVANGIRANYARGFAENGNGISKLMGGFALHNLVKFEPRIRAGLGLKP